MTATIRIFALVTAIFMLASGCVTMKEKRQTEDLRQEPGNFSYLDVENETLPVLHETSTIEDYVHYAMLNNTGLKSAFDLWKAALEKVGPARTLPDPRFSYAYYIEEIETRLGPQKHKFGISQMFPWFGKLDLQGNIAFQMAEIERQKFEAAMLALEYEVKKQYYEYYYIGRAINVTNESMALLTYMENVAQTKYTVGAGGQGGIIKVQVEMGKLEDRLRALQDMTIPIRARLNSALGRPADSELFLPKALDIKNNQLEDKKLFSSLIKKNPRLMMIDIMLKKEEMAVRLAEKNYYPDITLGLDYIQTDPRTDMNPGGNGNDPVIAMLSFNIPLWRDKYDSIKQEASLRLMAAKNDRKENELLLVADLEGALFGLRDAERKIDLYRNTLIPKAEQAMNVVQGEFVSGQSVFLDLIDSQRILLEFQLNYERALADRAKMLAEIEMLVGGAVN